MTKKKILLLVGAVCLLIALVVGVDMALGSREPAADAPAATPGLNLGETATYTLRLTTVGGKPLEGVGVYFYTDETRDELVWFAKTDETGIVTFTDVVAEGYIAVLDNVPEGYKVEPFYPLTGLNTEVVLSAGMEEVDLSQVTYHLGDAMHNFSFTAPDGTVYVLSELLEEKSAVMLNFWYLQCEPCKSEFPYLQEAYEDYSDDIAVLAMNPVNQDNDEIEKFRKQNGLTFPMAACDEAWTSAMQIQAFPTTVVVDRYGSIAMIHEGAITETETFENIFRFFTAEDYEQTTVKDLEDLEEAQPGSDPENPIEIGGKTSFQLTVEPGQLVYCHLYRLDNMYLQIVNDNAYAVYNNQTIQPSYGRLGFTIHCADTYTPAVVAFGNSGSETQTYQVNLGAYPGSYMNPYTLELDKNFTTTSAAGNDQGVYYVYYATEDATLTVQCLDITDGVRFNYVLYNMSTGRMNTLQDDGDVSKGIVTVPVKKGNKVQVTMCALPNDSNAIPAVTFTTLATLGDPVEEEDKDEENMDYAVTVTNEKGEPMTGITLILTVDGKPSTLKTNEKGVAYTNQKKDTYSVKLSLPEGYTAGTTQFQLTQEYPYLSVRLAPEAEKFPYTVTAVDDQGDPVANVSVRIGLTAEGYTNEAGQVTFALEEGSYTAQITPPLGYTVENPQYSFPEGSKELTVTLTRAEEAPDEDANKLDYIVTVLDYTGTAQADVLVRILKDGAFVTSGTTGSSGIAAFRLDPGSYTLELEENCHYNEETAVLPEGTTSVTVRMARGVSGEFENIYDVPAFVLHVGATYVQLDEILEEDSANYFLFTPEVSGTYRFATLEPEAKLSYWGANTSFLWDQTANTDYTPETNSFTLNIKESNLGSTYILGLRGGEEAVVLITRIDDAELDETDMPYTEYTGNPPDKAYKLTVPAGKTLKNVNITGSSADFALVKGTDGYYHLGSATGPVMYLRLTKAMPYAGFALSDVLGVTGDGGQNFCHYFYDSNGKLILKERYNQCLTAYCEKADTAQGVYPLTDDLMYIMQMGGQRMGWWDTENSNCLFTDEEGNLTTNFNPEIAWMFGCCYLD